MLLGMYVVWWVVGKGRPGARGVSIAIITQQLHHEQQASNQEKRKKELKKKKKSHKHW
jgi:hypothetical protein